jgi:hypothetical protein
MPYVPPEVKERIKREVPNCRAAALSATTNTA